MDNSIFLVLLLALPILGGLISFVTQKNTGWFIGVAFSAITVVLSIFAYSQLVDGSLTFEAEWIPLIGANFNLSYHAVSFLMCLLTGLVFLLSFIFIDVETIEKPARFYGLMLLAQAGLLGVFLADDAFLFYMFWELALIPVYFLCSMYGGKDRVKASFKFFIYTFIGSLLMLIAIIYIHQQGVTQNFAGAIFSATGNGLPPLEQKVLFAMFFLAFAIKMPIFPFHTWQPDTYQQSATPVTIVLSALMVKMGLFAMMTWLLPVLQLGAEFWKDTVMILSVVSIVYASCMALVQSNIKRLVAYSSIAHIGLMCAALFSCPILGEAHLGGVGVIIQMFNHGINILGLWLLVYIIEKRFGTQDLKQMGGIAKVAPIFTTALVIISFANIGLPLTNSFPAEFIMFTALFTSGSAYAIGLTVFAGLSIILGAIYTLRMIQQVAFGPEKSNTNFKDLDWSETMVMVIIIGLILALGFYPNLIINLINTLR